MLRHQPRVTATPDRRESVAGHPAPTKSETPDLAALLATAEPLVRKQLQRYPLSPEDRDDVAQQTLLQITRRIDSFRGDSAISTWIFRVTANQVLMSMRSQRRRRARIAEGVSPTEIVEQGGESKAQCDGVTDVLSLSLAKERQRWVEKAMGELPGDYRAVVIAHYHRDQGLQEIAGDMDLTESAVRSRLHRARQKLKELLAQNEELTAA
jgi:RNA polymerase sigma-70 factor, ECF subfamily